MSSPQIFSFKPGDFVLFRHPNQKAAGLHVCRVIEFTRDSIYDYLIARLFDGHMWYAWEVDLQKLPDPLSWDPLLIMKFRLGVQTELDIENFITLNRILQVQKQLPDSYKDL